MDRSFIGVGGVSLNRGISDYDFDTAQIQKIMMKTSKEVIILADSSKIENVSLTKVGHIDDVNLIITDSNINQNILDKYLKNGIEIICK